MADSREQLLEMLNPLIADFIVKAKNGRIRDKETSNFRIKYANSLARLITAYNQLLKDKEMEDLMQEVENLKNELIKQSEKGYP